MESYYGISIEDVDEMRRRAQRSHTPFDERVSQNRELWRNR